MDNNTLRILSLDGGGMKGYFSVVGLQKIINLWKIQSNELWKYFDVICGSSIGGIQALAYSYGLSPDDMASLLVKEGPWIFTTRTLGEQFAGSCDANTPSNRPSFIDKINILGNNDYFYNSPKSTYNHPVCATNNFGSGHLNTLLKNIFKTDTLKSLKTNTLITAYNRTTNTPTFFSNYDHPAFSGKDFLISDVAMSTAAAPVLYFAPYVINETEYIDGGTVQNNPSQIGLTLAKMIKPSVNRFCILSIGAGRGLVGFDPVENEKDLPFSNVVKEIGEIISVTMGGCSEIVERALSLESKFSPFSNLYYYRFNADVDPNQANLDLSTDAAISYLKQLAEDKFESEETQITTFLAHLTA